MTKEIKVNSSTDDSKKLQKIIDSNGNTPSIFNFSEAQEIEINSRIEVYPHTRWEGHGCTFTLMDNAPVNPFGAQNGLIGAKYLSGVEDLTFRNFTIDGNYKVQKYAYQASGNDHGDGWHNQLEFGNPSDPQNKNLVNCTFENLTLGNSYGDGVRVNGGSNLVFKDITSNFGGHDVIHLSAVNKADISKIVDHNPRANNDVRTRNCTNIDVHDCEIIYGKGYDTGAPFQSECITPNRTSSHIRYYNNVIKGMKGAAFYCVASQPANDIQIYNNLIVDCGQLEAGIKIPYVGGATILGWTNAQFYNNTVVGCRGYGVVDGTFKYQTKQKGSIKVYRNIFTGMKEPYTKGPYGGTAIAHLTGAQTSMEAWDNCLWGNTRDLYEVTQKSGEVKADPLFVGKGDYHLKSSSPCRLSGYQLGCYNDTQIDEPVIENPTSIFVHCSESEADQILTKYNSDYILYRSS